MPLTRQHRRATDRAARRRPDFKPPRRPFVLWLVGVVVIAAGWATWDWYRHATPIRDGSPNWSPDGRVIVYYSERRGAAADLYLMDDKGEEIRQLTWTPAADEGSPTFSPDGEHIAFDTDRDRNFEIYVMTKTGQNQRRLTNNPARDLSPTWSRDGHKIVFMSDRDARPKFDLYRMNTDGSGVERLTTSESNWFPQYSPDGRKLALHVWNDVHVMDLATRTLTRLTREPANGMHPTWSPQGDKLAFMTWRNGPTELFTMNLDGTDQQRVVAMPDGSVIDPRWSPKSDRLVFVHVPEENVREEQSPTQQRVIYLAELGTGKLTRLSR
jgi:TolB protein